MNKSKWSTAALLFPSCVLFLLFYYWPLLQNIYLSFFSWNMISPLKKYVGLQNYITIFSSAEFLQIVGNTVLFVVLLLVLNFVLPYIYSFILGHVLHKPHPIYQGILFIPSLIGLSVASLLFLWIYNPLAGPIQLILHCLGYASPRWFKTPILVIAAISTIIGWKIFGYNLLIFMAAMVSVPAELLEAARLENASNWIIFRKVIMPQISATAMYVFTVTIVFGLQYILVPVNLITQGGPDQGSSNLVYIIYQYAFVFYKTGTAAAYAVITMVLYGGFLYVRQRFLEKKVYYEN